MERATRQQAAIRSAIEAAGRPLSPQEVLEVSRVEVESLGLATVYRSLKRLLDDGSIQLVNLPGDGPRYEAAVHDHHHHFQCRICSRVFDVHECPGDLAALAPPGFTVERHEITLYGRCDQCTAPKPAAKARRRPV